MSHGELWYQIHCALMPLYFQKHELFPTVVVVDIHFPNDCRELFSVKRDVHYNDRREKFVFQFQGTVIKY